MERIILHALGEGSIADIDHSAVVGYQNLIMTALIVDADLDTFLSDVRDLADQWL